MAVILPRLASVLVTLNLQFRATLLYPKGNTADPTIVTVGVRGAVPGVVA